MFYLKVKKLKDEARIDSPAIEGDAGYDIYAPQDIDLNPGESLFIPSGLAVEFPKGYVGRIENKSSIMKSTPLYFMPGIIDAGYRGEIGIIVRNISNKEHVKLLKGRKMCQICFYQIGSNPIEFVDELSESSRGTGGFGSTGA